MTKFFEIGMQKTGSKSLALAFQQLGFTASHGMQSEADEWFDAVSHGRLAQSDFIRRYDYHGHMAPWFRELDEAYPDAKFILLVRNVDDWLDSCEKAWSRGDIRFRGLVRHRVLTHKFLQRAAFFRGCVFYGREHFLLTYEEHVAAVLTHFKGDTIRRRERLLYMNICDGDGWEKLCPFLGIPAPPEPFPHRHHRWTLRDQKRRP